MVEITKNTQDDMHVLSIGDSLPTGSFNAFAHFSKAVNFRTGTRHFSVVSRAIGGGPVNIVLDTDTMNDIDRVDLYPDRLVIDGFSITRDGLPEFSSTISFNPPLESSYAESWDPDVFMELVSLLGNRLVCQAPRESMVFVLHNDDNNDHDNIAVFFGDHGTGFKRALAARLMSGVEQLTNCDAREGVALLKGVGPGLTPMGDDYLTGTLMGLYIQQHYFGYDHTSLRAMIFQRAYGNNPISNTYLYHAYHGLFFEPWKQLLTVLLRPCMHDAINDDISETTGNPKQNISVTGRIEGAVDRIISSGATSGADALVGFLVTLQKGVAL